MLSQNEVFSQAWPAKKHSLPVAETQAGQADRTLIRARHARQASTSCRPGFCKTFTSTGVGSRTAPLRPACMQSVVLLPPTHTRRLGPGKGTSGKLPTSAKNAVLVHQSINAGQRSAHMAWLRRPYGMSRHEALCHYVAHSRSMRQLKTGTRRRRMAFPPALLNSLALARRSCRRGSNVHCLPAASMHVSHMACACPSCGIRITPCHFHSPGYPMPQAAPGSADKSPASKCYTATIERSGPVCSFR